MDHRRLLKFLGICFTAWMFSACGQDPSFLELDGKRGSSDGRGDPNSISDYPGEEEDLRGDLDAHSDEDYNGGWIDDEYIGSDPDLDSGTEPGGDSSGDGRDNKDPGINIPDARNDDLGAIHRCLQLWGGNHPFGSEIKNYRRIHASVNFGGFGTPINDQVRTEEPYLVLISAGVNVASNIEYNMLNPNGYYCMKVGVNVSTTLNINLHCNARLADSSVQVNVGSTTNSDIAGVGVAVGSNIDVRQVRPQGDTCR